MEQLSRPADFSLISSVLCLSPVQAQVAAVLPDAIDELHGFAAMCDPLLRIERSAGGDELMRCLPCEVVDCCGICMRTPVSPGV